VTVAVFRPGTSGWNIDLNCRGASPSPRFAAALSGTPSRVVVYAQAGDDDVTVAASIARPAWLYGGAGDDRLRGGSGGERAARRGPGTIFSSAGSSRDLLIGGTGADRLVGNAADDVLVAGYTMYDANEAALAAIQGVWVDPAKTYQQRVTALTTTGVGGGPGGEAERGDGVRRRGRWTC